MSDVLTFVVSLTTGSFAGIAAVWVLRNWISERIKNSIKHEYDAKLESHKAQLSAENSVTLERLKSQLHATALERQVQFSAVYVKREELLQKLHHSLNKVLDACVESTRVGSTSVSEESHAAFRVMHGMLEEAAIYFPEAFSERWHQQTLNLKITLETFLAARASQTRNYTADLERSKTTYDEHLSAYKRMRSELRQEIRKWLGIASPNTNP